MKTPEKTMKQVKTALDKRAAEIEQLRQKIKASEDEATAKAVIKYEAIAAEDWKGYKEKKAQETDATDAADFYRARLEQLEREPLADPETQKATIEGLLKEAEGLAAAALEKWLPVFEDAYHDAADLEAKLNEYNSALIAYQDKICKTSDTDRVTIWKEYNTAEALFKPLCDNQEAFTQLTGKQFLPFTVDHPHGGIIEK